MEEGATKLQQKVIKKGRMKIEMGEVPVFPRQAMYVEDLVLDAIKFLKSKASEENVIEYLDRRFSDINHRMIISVLDKLIFEERISLKRGKKGDKRPLDNLPDFDYLRSSPKRQKVAERSITMRKEVPVRRKPPVKKEETVFDTDPESED